MVPYCLLLSATTAERMGGSSLHLFIFFSFRNEQKESTNDHQLYEHTTLCLGLMGFFEMGVLMVGARNVLFAAQHVALDMWGKVMEIQRPGVGAPK
jgi:hypothetical protein